MDTNRDDMLGTETAAPRPGIEGAVAADPADRTARLGEAGRGDIAASDRTDAAGPAGDAAPAPERSAAEAVDDVAEPADMAGADPAAEADPAIEADPAPAVPAPEEPQTTEISLAGTATPAYADACAQAADALQDLLEHNLAMTSLTAVLPPHDAPLYRAGRDGSTQAMPRVASEEPADAPGEPRRPRISRRAAVALSVAAVLVCAAGAFFALGGPSLLARVSEADVERVLAADPGFMDGFASNDYVVPSEYSLSDVRITQTQTDSDGAVMVDAAATLENESFSSDCLVILKFARAQDADRIPELSSAPRADGETWVGAVVQSSAETRAIAPVTADPDFPQGIDVSFDADAQTCSFEDVTEDGLWFGARTTTVPYTYSFDGAAWSRAAGEADSSFALDADALAGAYAASGSGAGSFSAFALRGVDAAAGTFTIEYKASTGGLAPQTVTGVIECALEVRADADSSLRQPDGYVYAFAGEGTSTGGAGASRIEGAIGLDGTLIVDATVDYTRPAFLFGPASDEELAISGTLARA